MALDNDGDIGIYEGGTKTLTELPLLQKDNIKPEENFLLVHAKDAQADKHVKLQDLFSAVDKIEPRTEDSTVGTYDSRFASMHTDKLIIGDKKGLMTSYGKDLVLKAGGDLGEEGLTGTVDIQSDVLVQGNLTVQGTSTTLHAENLSTSDTVIELNKPGEGSVPTDPAIESGIEIQRDTDAFAVVYKARNREETNVLCMGHRAKGDSSADLTPIAGRVSDMTDGDVVVWDEANKVLKTSASGGNAGSSDKWSSPMDLILEGDVEGTATFDGSAATTMTVTIDGVQHDHSTQYHLKTEADERFLIKDGTDGPQTVNSSITMAEGCQVIGNLAGNADSATQLIAPSTITLDGGVTGSFEYNGKDDVTVAITVQPNEHTHEDIYYEIEADTKFLTKDDTVTDTQLINSDIQIGANDDQNKPTGTVSAKTFKGNIEGSALSLAQPITLTLEGDVTGTAAMSAGGTEYLMETHISGNKHTHDARYLRLNGNAGIYDDGTGEENTEAVLGSQSIVGNIEVTGELSSVEKVTTPVLDVTGSIEADSEGVTITPALTVEGTSTLKENIVAEKDLAIKGKATITGNLEVNNNLSTLGTATFTTLTASGDATLSALTTLERGVVNDSFQVKGDTTVQDITAEKVTTNTLSVTGSTTLVGVTASNLVASSLTANSISAETLGVSDLATFSGGATIRGTALVETDLTIGTDQHTKELLVKGSTEITGALQASSIKATTAELDGVEVTGSTQLAELNATSLDLPHLISTIEETSGDGTVWLSNISTDSIEAASLDLTSDLTVAQDATITGELTVTGDTTLGSVQAGSIDATNAIVAGTVSGEKPTTGFYTEEASYLQDLTGKRLVVSADNTSSTEELQDGSIKADKGLFTNVSIGEPKSDDTVLSVAGNISVSGAVVATESLSADSLQILSEDNESSIAGKLTVKDLDVLNKIVLSSATAVDLTVGKAGEETISFNVPSKGSIMDLETSLLNVASKLTANNAVLTTATITDLSGDMNMTGKLDVTGDLDVTGAVSATTVTVGNTTIAADSIEATTFTGSLNGNATTASSLDEAQTFELTGKVSGTTTSDLSEKVSLNVTSINDDDIVRKSVAEVQEFSGSISTSSIALGTGSIDQDDYTGKAATAGIADTVTQTKTFIVGGLADVNKDPKDISFTVDLSNETAPANLDLSHGHDYSEIFAPLTHSHEYTTEDEVNTIITNLNLDNKYAAEGHDHSGTYATEGHNHNGTYATEGHEHSQYTTTSQVNDIITNLDLGNTYADKTATELDLGDAVKMSADGEQELQGTLKAKGFTGPLTGQASTVEKTQSLSISGLAGNPQGAVDIDLSLDNTAIVLDLSHTHDYATADNINSAIEDLELGSYTKTADADAKYVRNPTLPDFSFYMEGLFDDVGEYRNDLEHKLWINNYNPTQDFLDANIRCTVTPIKKLTVDNEFVDAQIKVIAYKSDAAQNDTAHMETLQTNFITMCNGLTLPNVVDTGNPGTEISTCATVTTETAKVKRDDTEVGLYNCTAPNVAWMLKDSDTVIGKISFSESGSHSATLDNEGEYNIVAND